MKNWKKLVLLAVVVSFAAVPGTAVEEDNQDVDDCCMSCAHYYYTSPDGQVTERWDCMGFDCSDGWLDCWEYYDRSKHCVLLWACWLG